MPSLKKENQYSKENNMDKETLIQVHDNVKPYIHETPVLTSELINKICGCHVYFKCENFQKMGAFKMRGAINAIQNLTSKQKENGVVTHSSGNFAQAISLASKYLNTKAFIVMPENAPQVKKDAVLNYQGIIIECKSNIKAREIEAERIVKNENATFIHPSNNDQVILGQSTSAKELLEKQSDLDIILAPVGGGGLLAGTALSAKYFSSNCEVIGAEPENVDDAYRSLKSGKIEYNKNTTTIADGLRTNLGDRNFPIILENVKKIIRVSEEEIINAMKLVWERMKMVIEPSSAVPLAALLKEKQNFKNKKVGIIISGGNVDLTNLPF